MEEYDGRVSAVIPEPFMRIIYDKIVRFSKLFKKNMHKIFLCNFEPCHVFLEGGFKVFSYISLCPCYMYCLQHSISEK